MATRLIGNWRLVKGKLRRFYYVHARKAYVQRQMLLRQGECRQCGCCCTFLFRCIMLTGTGLCRTYHTGRWLACSLFPLDEKDVADVALVGGRCGYWFGDRD